MSERDRSDRAPIAVTVALSVTLATAAFMLAMPVVMSVVPATVLPPPFPTQHQRGETLTFLLTFVVLLPLAVWTARRLADAVAAGPRAAELGPLVALLALLLAGALVTVKALGRFAAQDGVWAVFAAALVWWLAAGALLGRMRSASGPTALGPLSRRAPRVWMLVGAATFVVLLCLTHLRSISFGGLVLCAAAATIGVAAYGRVRPRVTRRYGITLDVVLLLVVIALVPDLIIVRPEAAARNAEAAIDTGIIGFHHDFFLGPANEVLHGRPMLVGTASQYGVTSIYLLTAWFGLAPIGYGTLGLLTGLLTALWFAAGFAILRLVGTPRWLSAGALGVGIVALTFSLRYPVGALPQSGPLRFGLPMVLLLLVVLAERWPNRPRAALALVASVLGIASVWSFEAFAFTGATFAAVAIARARLAPQGDRWRELTRHVVAGAVASVLAHMLFALLTLIATGELPDWSHYLAYLRQFLFGSLGDLTYDVDRWTPGFAVAALYVASAAGLFELWRRRGPIVETERPTLIALVGMTAYGVALFSYYVDRSLSHIIIQVSLPALLVGALWLGLLLRSGPAVTLAARRAGLAAGLLVAALLLAAPWSVIGSRLPRTPLAHAAPGGASLPAAFDRLWHLPALNPSAPKGERTLAKYLPGERRSLMMVHPNLSLEVLMRSGRADALFLGDAWETSFAPEELPVVKAAVDDLRAGRRMVMDALGRRLTAKLRPGESIGLLPSSGLAPLQQAALQRIVQRFRLQPIGPQDGTFSVVELQAR